MSGAGNHTLRKPETDVEVKKIKIKKSLVVETKIKK